jgi:hypothetical protein
MDAVQEAGGVVVDQGVDAVTQCLAFLQVLRDIGIVRFRGQQLGSVFALALSGRVGGMAC